MWSEKTCRKSRKYPKSCCNNI
ncbi:BnaA02g26790D [Brassica napus]|uniref:BnaA02g26790D protein n=1 Tax=Brassica napus TaxID=3708 RepID=A0A078F7F5_BRANA|nr:BnaA02g26790D [Brassica napus]